MFIKVDLPEAASGPLEVDDDEPMLVVSVKADGTYYINLGEAEELPVLVRDHPLLAQPLALLFAALGELEGLEVSLLGRGAAHEVFDGPSE